MNYRAIARDINNIPKSAIQRFYSYVDFGDCWNWVGGKSGSYGSFSFKGKAYYAHRFSYYATNNISHDELLTIDHLCKNTLCVNPDHLELVTQRVNTLRSSSPAAKNKLKVECLRGHAFDLVNTGYDTRGDRYCKKCRAEHGRRNRYTRRASK